MRSGTRGAAIAGLLAWAVVLGGCNGKAKRDQAQFQSARQHHAAALAALRAGDLDAAHQGFGEARSDLLALRARAGRPGMDEYELPEGPVFEGRSSKAWQDRWAAEFHDAAVAELGHLRERVVAGTLDWSRVRSFMTTHAREVDDQVVAMTQVADAARNAREGDTYVWDCSIVDSTLCEELLPLLREKTDHPISLAPTLTMEGRQSAFGVLHVRPRFDAYQRYDQLRAGPGGKDVFSIPARLVLEIEVEHHRGSSNWAGRHVTAVELTPPQAISADDSTATWNRHIAALGGLLLDKVKTMERQQPQPVATP